MHDRDLLGTRPRGECVHIRNVYMIMELINEGGNEVVEKNMSSLYTHDGILNAVRARKILISAPVIFPPMVIDKIAETVFLSCFKLKCNSKITVFRFI